MLAGALPGAGGALAQCATFALRALLLCLVFVFVRASLPRQRFDQLIALCWKYLFPLSLTLVLWSLALYSLASRWLRGSELLSLAASGDGGVPTWVWVTLGVTLGFGLAKVLESQANYPLGEEPLLHTPDAVRAMLRRFAEGSPAGDTFDVPLMARALGNAGEVTLQIQGYHPERWGEALCLLAQGPRGGPYVPFSISRSVDTLLPPAEMLWDMDTWGALALALAFSLGLRTQLELQNHLQEATAVLSNLRLRRN